MVGRNDACPCGSGKKYKHCHGGSIAPATLAGFPLAHQLFMQRRYAEAERVCEQALKAQPDLQDGWFLYAACILEQQHYERALAALRHLAALAPQRPEVYFNIGQAHERRGDPAAAIAAYRAAVALAPGYAPAWNSLGSCLKEAGQIEGAIAACRELIKLTPDAAPALTNLGAALRLAGELDEAANCYEQALERDPRYPPAHNNLGNLRAARGDPAGAEASLREALRLDPNFAQARINLAAVLRETGRFDQGLAEYRQALQLQPANPQAWTGLVAGLQGYRYTADDAAGRRELIAALSHPAIDPLALVPVAVSLLRHTPTVQALLEADSDAVPLAQLAPLFAEPLLGALLEIAVIADWQLEAALRRLRAALLAAVSEGAALPADAAAFAARLAAQCLLTEYLYLETPVETAQVEALAQRLEQTLGQQAVDPAVTALLALYACYRPLHGLTAHARIPALPGLARLVQTQLEAPCEEARLRAGLKHFGTISDSISRAVQAQYEEHPYPRWERVGLPGTQPLAGIVRKLAPEIVLPAGIDIETPQVLVAGCGTGRHPLQTATRIAGARVLAVDLSGASLGYAMRKAREAGAANLEFMQADILELGALGRQFDLVESFGVLHHMRDPLAGWRILTGLTRPGGLMLIGLYSERARAAVVACREFVRARGYASDAAAIRRFRHDLVREGAPEVVATIRNSPDFYSISDCRDLIFHVQEHRYTLPQIAAMGESLGLRCLGMDLDNRALYAGLPGAGQATLPALNDLAGWDEFEQAHPAAFGSTYKIWWQKR
ncbi:MAG: tetratricopeptide repeat protein [Bradyrhizobium sp.]|nr:tetratricopeptide repeat protein [Bradyrhizobium sp.]